MPKLHFHGAVHGVTGSSYVIETPSGLLLVDCGMYQGGRRIEEQNREPFGFEPRDIKWVILTHAHIDHSGRLPLLVKRGYAGEIMSHPAACDLAAIMLADSAKIQEEDAAYETKKRQRGELPGRGPAEPLYTMEDAEATATRLRPVPYGEVVQLSEDIRFRLIDAGHILGSSSAEVWLRDGDRPTRLTFSGDIGATGNPLLRDPEVPSATDFLVMESTYGNREHEPPETRSSRLREIVGAAVSRPGCVVIPSFSVGRTQEVVYILNGLVESHALPRLKAFVDSPLALEATGVFRKHPECFNRALRDQIAGGDDPFDFPFLHFTRTVDESKAINTMPPPLVIISAAGMCNAGRIRHHLLHHLGRREDTILFVGYQAQNTLGRRIKEGLDPIRIMGETIHVRARIEAIEGFSAHADRAGLLDWFGRIPGPPGLTFVTHGETPASLALRDALEQTHQAQALVPDPGQVVDLSLDNQALLEQVRQQATRPFTPLETGADEEPSDDEDG
jgi:metallo-beta-lactamase family protein